MNFPRTFNPICKVYFGGFESDTLALQRAGWQLSAEQDSFRACVRLAMKHEQYGLYALTSSIELRDYHRFLSDQNFSAYCPLVFQVQWMGSNARFQIFPQMGAANFKPIDALPVFEERQEMSFEDMIPFRPLNMEAPEIVIAQQTVPELMDLILKMQDPKQKEIRDRARKQAWKDAQSGATTNPTGYNAAADIKAQIVCVAS